MTANLKRRVDNRPIRGGLYVSCAARGPNQFAAPESETAIIRDALGDFPMVGFFANGAPNRDRIYACTGVLTLFLQSSAAGVPRDQARARRISSRPRGSAQPGSSLEYSPARLRFVTSRPNAIRRRRSVSGSAGAGIRATVLLQ